jgi:hypothetical protein
MSPQPKRTTKKSAQRDEDIAPVQVGRPKEFEGGTERLNLMLPIALVTWIKQEALDKRATPGRVLFDILDPIMRAKKRK